MLPGPPRRGREERRRWDVTVDVISDVICPWCYIGKRRLEKAVAALGGRHEVRVRWHPFQLNPTMPEGGHGPQGRTAPPSSEVGSGRWPSTPRWPRRARRRASPFAFDKDRADAEHPRRPPPDRPRRQGGRAGRRGGGGLPGATSPRAGTSATGGPPRRGGRGRAGPGTGRGPLERRRGPGGDPGGGRTGPPCSGCRACPSSSSTARLALSGAREPQAFLDAFEQASADGPADEGGVCTIGPGGEPSC